jgi:hypothetical protein
MKILTRGFAKASVGRGDEFAVALTTTTGDDFWRLRVMSGKATILADVFAGSGDTRLWLCRAGDGGKVVMAAEQKTSSRLGIVRRRRFEVSVGDAAPVLQ